jgi:hypothetical protein
MVGGGPFRGAKVIDLVVRGPGEEWRAVDSPLFLNCSSGSWRRCFAHRKRKVNRVYSSLRKRLHREEGLVRYLILSIGFGSGHQNAGF